MKASPQLLLEADRCFQYVCEKITQDNVHPRSVLFGSTLAEWLSEGAPKIIVVGTPPTGAYRRVFIRSAG